MTSVMGERTISLKNKNPGDKRQGFLFLVFNNRFYLVRFKRTGGTGTK